MEILDCFPFKTLRDQQKEVLDEILEAYNSGYKYLLLEAPTGFGKSPVGVCVARYFQKGHLVTATKQLQDQYQKDFPEIPSVKGRSNFTCLLKTRDGKALTCAQGRCVVGLRCELKNECPYYIQKETGFKAPITIYNYSYFLSEKLHVNDIPDRDFLLLDEAHTIESEISSAMSIQLTEKSLQGLVKDFVIPDLGSMPSNWQPFLAKTAGMLLEFHEHLLRNDDFLYELQIAAVRCQQRLNENVFLASEFDEHPDDWVIAGREEDGKGGLKSIVFKPISVDRFASRIFESAERKLLMSATILDKESLCRGLGICEDSARFIRVEESSFPVEHRPIYVAQVAWLNRNTMNENLPSIVNAIDLIMDRYPLERGVIHTTSYQQADFIREHLTAHNSSRILASKPDEDRSQLLSRHAKRKSGVLLSPSLYLGVDLKDELSRFQIIVKVPYPDLSDTRVKAKMEKDPRWYDWQTALRLVQTYGRSVRSKDDYADTYVLDSTFIPFLRHHSMLFPKWFTEALRPISEAV